MDKEHKYSIHWHVCDQALSYFDPKFQFHPEVIIVELDGCLIDHITSVSLYKGKQITIYDEKFIKRLVQDSANKSIVILSNQISNKKLTPDVIKRKTEFILKYMNIPILCFFATKPNYLMKPHTGLYRLLVTYYRNKGHVIKKATVVSNQGGLVVDRSDNNIVAYNDIDRAFAYNNGITYVCIDEYLDNCLVDYVWDTTIIPPETRLLYIKQMSMYKNPDIFKILAKQKTNSYVIMLYGAPRCGKTTLAKEIKKKWDASDFSIDNELVVLSDDLTKRTKYSRFIKCVKQRFSVLLDGEYHTDKLREPYLAYLRKHKIPILIIEVQCGIEFAKVLNHVYVEEKKDLNIMLYRRNKYDIYKSTSCKPTTNHLVDWIQYVPYIQINDMITKFRY